MRASSGFAYVEVLVAAVIVVVALVPASNAFRAASRQAEFSKTLLAQHYRALASLEITRARTFTELFAEASTTGGTTPVTGSDAQGATNRRLIYVARFDFDNADKDNDPTTGIDNDYLRVNVQVEGLPISLFSVVAKSP
jgi:type II secretory pathway pseudopilin PulG